MNLQEVHNFWRNPDAKNDPEKYLHEWDRTEFLIGIFEKYIKKNKSVLEIGCNSGRNLSGLCGVGYKKLSGIEINENAVAILRKTFPCLDSIEIYNGPVEIEIKKIDSVDVIFTMAVLEHIHNASEQFLFSRINDICKEYLITIEDENKISPRHFKRNYKTVFEAYNYNQVEIIRCKDIKGLGRNYNARIFRRKNV